MWTCDGAEYVAGDDGHDGFLAIHAAMLSVDPTIQVGAVGVGEPGEWSDWDAEVLEGAAGELDFYVIHAYGFDSSPSGESAVNRPSELWPGIVEGIRNDLGSAVPLAVTEYNLVSFEAGDSEQTMTKVMNALFLADTVGQLALQGVEIANQWNLANGTAESGTDYGMIRLDDGSRSPQYEAMSMWSRAGSELLPVTIENDVLRAYVTRHADGRLTALLLNLSGEEVASRIEVVNGTVGGTAEMESLWTADLSDTEFSTDTSEVSVSDGRLSVTLPAWSMNMLELVES